MSHIEIGGRRIGPGEPAYVLAEVSGNHNGDLGKAVAIIEAAAEAGADAVKLQTYRPDTITIDADTEWFLVGEGSLWSQRRLYDLYEEAHTPWEWFPRLVEAAAASGIQVFSTPFDRTAVDLHESLGLPAHKIASFELIDHDLIEYAASTGKPLVMSTGMATVEEIDEAVGVARAAGAGGIALLHCNSAYPAPISEMNLRTMLDMRDRWGVPTGLSDHTLGTTAAIAAVALGSCIIEKHLCLSRDDPGPDTAFSLEPDELAHLVTSVRDVEAAMGGVRYGATAAEGGSVAFRRSIFVVADIAAGELLTRENVRVIRPGHGMAPKELGRVLGRRAAVDLRRGTPLAPELLD